MKSELRFQRRCRWQTFFPAVFLLLLIVHATHAAARVVRAKDMTVAPGQTNRLLITLEGQGNESALGFNISFDLEQLQFVRAVGGIDSTNAGATVNVNLNELDLGHVGMAVGLNIFAGETYPAGTNVVAEIYFTPAAGVTTGVSAVVFTNTPVPSEISDGNAEPLPFTFAGANVFVQIPCAYALNTNAVSFAASGGGSAINLSAGPSCSWTVVNTNPWVTVTSPTSGSGSVSVNYTVAANGSSVSRAGNILIAGQSFTVTQQGLPCIYSLSTNAASFSAAGGTGSVSLTTVFDCPWSVVNTNPWLAVTSATNGFGSTTVNYSVANNLNGSDRVGTVIIAGQNFSVTQPGVACAYVLSATNRVHSYPAVTDSVNISVNTPCPWSVSNTNSWITIVSGSNGVGNGTITYSASANATSADRSGALVIGGQVFGITQHGLGCNYSVSPTKRSHGFGTATNFFTVSAGAGCSWIVLNTNSWITITNGNNGNIGNGLGGATVGYTVSANPFPTERFGVLNVEGATLIITQAATTCTYTLSPTNRAHTAAASNATVNVSAGSTCTWSATTTNNWIALASNPSGTGNGSFSYSVPAYIGATSRTGTIAVANQVFTVTQPGYVGSFSFQPLSVGAGGAMVLSATGGPSGVWELQLSSNLTTWSKLADLTNSTGRVDYLAPNVGGRRFFRAILP